MRKVVNLFGKKEVNGAFVPREVGDRVNMADGYWLIVTIGDSLGCFPGGTGVVQYVVQQDYPPVWQG